ncbi:hypothetical protein NDN08_000686 [Rhodosorus marinus]|uniref:RNA-binding S4 domain-containing protein n=1 Tax=Rhodosorus marinus TaxID=101924 RepID=A0AAV8UNP0_9RHOD|nr:hypothetical protein NDN08_000686 [Rhodosorus marinus]
MGKKEPQLDENGPVEGKEFSMDLDDYRAGDRFRDVEEDWEEADTGDDADEIVYENVSVDEFGMDSEGRDVVEDGLPLKPVSIRRKKTHEKADPASEPILPENQKLLNALKVFKIAASDTCEYLIRAGKVEVNGSVVKDSKFAVNARKDKIVVNGGWINSKQSIDLAERTKPKKGKRKKKAEPEPVTDQDVDILPRGQRDFRSSKVVKRNEEGEKFKGREIDGGFSSKRGKRRPRY